MPQLHDVKNIGVQHTRLQVREHSELLHGANPRFCAQVTKVRWNGSIALKSKIRDSSDNLKKKFSEYAHRDAQAARPVSAAEAQLCSYFEEQGKY